MSLQIRHQFLWWACLAFVLACCWAVILVGQVVLAHYGVLNVGAPTHAIIVCVGALTFFLAEGPAKGLVEALEKIQTSKEVQDVRLIELVSRLLIIKKRALLLQELLSYGRNFLVLVAAVIGQSTFFAALPVALTYWLLTTAYVCLVAMLVGTILVRRWRMTAEELREHVRVISLKHSQRAEQSRAFLLAQAVKYRQPTEQPSLGIISLQ